MSAVSEFYVACRDGDFATVEHLLPHMSDEEKNQIEPNGSTALHAATYYGHHSVVKLLLKNGCATWIRNKYQNTPYNEAQDDEMRQLFERPERMMGNGRFASADDCFTVVKRTDVADKDSIEDDDNIPKGFVDGYKHVGNLKEREAILHQIVHAQMMKYCLRKFQVSDTCQDVRKLLEKSIPQDNMFYQQAITYFENFRNHQDVRELILLYTLQTPFYKALHNNVDSFAIELYSRLSAFKERSFPGGETYRGLTMTDDSIKAYRWASKDKGRMIEIKTMTSTSLKEDTAMDIANDNKAPGKHCILCVFEFPDVCYTAIDLNKTGSITYYPQEEEILLLPGTLFEVSAVENGPEDGWFTIHLKNIPVPQKTIDIALENLQDS